MRKYKSVFLVIVTFVLSCSSTPSSKGISLYNRERYGSAIAELTKVIAEHPDSEEAFTFRALSYYRKGENRLAALDLGVAVNLNPGYAPAFRALGLVYAKTGPLLFSEKYFRKCIELDPQYVDGFVAFAEFQDEQKKYKEAEELFRTALGLLPGPDDSRYIYIQSKIDKLNELVENPLLTN